MKFPSYFVDSVRVCLIFDKVVEIQESAQTIVN
ncbi:MAG: hypothetical protein ACJAUA_000691 [Zhongshania aliphaticivorans]|jgi:hypothetical protein